MAVAWNSRLVVHALNVILKNFCKFKSSCMYMYYLNTYKVLYNSILTKSKTTQKAFHLHLFWYTQIARP